MKTVGEAYGDLPIELWTEVARHAREAESERQARGRGREIEGEKRKSRVPATSPTA